MIHTYLFNNPHETHGMKGNEFWEYDGKTWRKCPKCKGNIIINANFHKKCGWTANGEGSITTKPEQKSFHASPVGFKTADKTDEPNLLDFAISQVMRTTGFKREFILEKLKGEESAISKTLNTLMIDEGKRRRGDRY